MKDSATHSLLKYTLKICNFKSLWFGLKKIKKFYNDAFIILFKVLKKCIYYGQMQWLMSVILLWPWEAKAVGLLETRSLTPAWTT